MPDLPEVLHLDLKVGHVLTGVVWLLLVLETLEKDVLVCVCDLQVTGVDGTHNCVFMCAIVCVCVCTIVYM